MSDKMRWRYGDTNPVVAAVDAATVNFGPRHQPRLLCRWDARSVPLADATVDVVVTNPPFGGKVPSANARDLYAAALAETARVLRPGGRLVMVAEDRELVLREAKRLGVLVAINPDAHDIAGLADTYIGVGIARKGWLEAGDVLNTRSAAEALKAMQRT
jgi:SAM-dependent methyltransferase